MFLNGRRKIKPKQNILFQTNVLMFSLFSSFTYVEHQQKYTLKYS